MGKVNLSPGINEAKQDILGNVRHVIINVVKRMLMEWKKRSVIGDQESKEKCQPQQK